MFPDRRVVYSEFGNAPAPEEVTPLDIPPQQQQVRIQASRSGRKGKTVTTVTGLQLSPDSLNALLKQLKNQCGSGGTIKDNTLEIQGDQSQKLLQIMTTLGYKAKISGGK
ncbi:MAG: translation initiation factor [Coleofasciculaceae cyanobacterium SM2_1_6]|nr:translation initiation factor [Coleofasciculaceae cyanobacterium SM2_1_6]